MLTMGPLQRHRGYVLLFIGLFATTFYSLYISAYPPYPFRVPRSTQDDPIPMRRDLARRILKVQRQLELYSGVNNGIDATLAQELTAVVSELDPRVVIPKDHQTSMDVTDSSKLLNVCPEIYKGREYDEETYQHNFIQVNCNARKFNEVLTVVLVARGWNSQRLDFVIKNIRKHYSVNIIALVFGNTMQSIEGSIIKDYSIKVSDAVALNNIIHTIDTPYILVMHSVTHFNSLSPLERPVRVLDDLEEVAVVSGSYRDRNGYWRKGCLQTTAGNYKLKYVRGYEHSSHECMFCDDVLGPFVVKTDFIKSVPMTDGLSGPTMYRDWFLNVRLSGKLVMSCPDVMFFVEAEQTLETSDWRTIAGTWSFQHIVSFDGREFEISCEDAQIQCKNLMDTVSSFLVAPCCREILLEELGYFQECAEELGLHYELSAGSLLGAVKMDGMLPWDFDTDIHTDCADKKIWTTKGYDCIKRKGCKPKYIIGNYWQLFCKTSFIDVTCRDNTRITLPDEYRHVATQAEVNGRWVKVSSNPGRSSRNRYGPEYLKHALHWRFVQNKNSSIIKDVNPDVTGLWNKCVEPAFHACTDHFPVDGNVHFKHFGRTL